MARLNVEEYGAEGDDETDDREAIQQAINDAEDGDTVYLPEGTYKVEEHPEDPYWGVSLLIVGEDDPHIDTSHADKDITIQGEGPDTTIRYGGEQSSVAIIAVQAGTADEEKMNLTVRNLVLEGDLNYEEASRANCLIINSGHNRSYVKQPTEGHDLTFEDIEIRNTTGRGFNVQGGGWRDIDYVGSGGIDTDEDQIHEDQIYAGVGDVTIRRLTVRNVVSGSALSLSGPTPTDWEDEEEVEIVAEDIKLVDNTGDVELHGGGGDHDSSNLHMQGRIIVDGFWIENTRNAGKISNDGTHVRQTNGTYTGIYDTENVSSILRDTTSGGDSIGMSWRWTIDNVRLVDSEVRAGRLSDHSDGIWDFGEIEINNVNRNDDRGGALRVNQSDDVAQIETLYLCNIPSDGLRTTNENADATVQNLYYNNVEGRLYDDGWTVQNEEQRECPELDVPDKDQLGAFTQGTSTERETTTESGSQSLRIYTGDTDQENSAVFGNIATGYVEGDEEHTFEVMGEIVRIETEDGAEVSTEQQDVE